MRKSTSRGAASPRRHALIQAAPLKQNQRASNRCNLDPPIPKRSPRPFGPEVLRSTFEFHQAKLLHPTKRLKVSGLKLLNGHCKFIVVPNIILVSKKAMNSYPVKSTSVSRRKKFALAEQTVPISVACEPVGLSRPNRDTIRGVSVELSSLTQRSTTTELCRMIESTCSSEKLNTIANSHQHCHMIFGIFRN